MVLRALQRLPIAVALIGLIALVAVLSPGLGYLLQSRAFDRAIEIEERQRADTTSGIITSLIGSRAPRLYGITRALKSHAGLQEALAQYQATGNAAPLKDLLDDLRRDTGLDQLQASDAAGRVIYRAHEPLRQGDTEPAPPALDEAPDALPMHLENGASGPSLRAAVPITRGGRGLGAIAAGTQLGDALARQLADAAGSQVTLAGHDGIWGSSLVPTERGAISQALVTRTLTDRQPQYETRDGHLIAYAPVNLGDGSLVLVTRTDAGAAAQIAQRSRRQLLMTAALTLGLALVTGALLGLLVTRPLRRLRAHAMAIAKRHGASPDSAQIGNEVVALESAFHAMADSLERERARLEVAHQEATAHGRELARREHEARDLAMVASRTHSAVVITDAAGYALWVNEAFTRISGYGAAEVLGRKPGELLQGPETDAGTITMMSECLRHGEGFHCEILNYAKDGRRYWLDMEVQPVLGAGGRLEKFMAVQLDITDRKRRENELRQAEEFLDSVVENIPAMVFVKDARELRYQRINRAAEQIIGLPREAFMGKSDSDFFPQEQARRYIEQDRRVLEGGAVLEIDDDSFDAADGSGRMLRTRKIPIRAKDGTPLYLLGISEDITEQHRQKLLLQNAKEEAEAASLAKSQFLANMSHEIRTPMNGMLGMTELLLGTVLSERQRRFAETAYRSGEALLEIINDILDFSKIEAGKLELQSEPFAPRQLMEDVGALLAPRAHQKRVELACEVDEALPHALIGDAGRLRQVLINLAGNAIKFTDEGEVALRMRVAAQDGGPGLCAIDFEIADTGIGMPPQVHQRLFRVFEQGSSATNKRYGGTGLGLAISQHLVQMMGGRIGVRSEAGKGSVFTFTLRLPVDHAHATQPAPQARDGTEDGAFLAGRRVLIVEDNPTNRGILIQQIEHWGADCAAVDSGFAALEMLRSAHDAGDPFEAALIDMKMPGMSGIELAERIKRAGELAAPRLCMLTSLSGPRELARARAAGIDLYLEKPVRQMDLRKALRNLLGESALAASPSTAPPTSAALAYAGDATGEAFACPAPAVATVPAPGTAISGPYPAGHAAAHAAHDTASPARAGDVASLRGRILVVEDNLVNQEITCTMLDQAGCAHAVADNGHGALHLLAEEAFDLVLMDCQMPEMDGYEAVRRIRAGTYGMTQGKGPATGTRVPVIAVTANALSGDRERCLAAGFDDYLSKPFAETDLRALLLRWLPGSIEAPRARPQFRTPEPAAFSLRPGYPALDPAVLGRLRAMESNGAHGLISRLTGAFLASAPPMFDELKMATARGDMPAARHAAHTLKSSNANVGALGVSRLFAQIEADARRSEASAAAARLDEAEREFNRVLEALRSLTPA
jgi:PAS domain S-box-containing protein